MLTKITNDAPQLINSIISIHAAFAAKELNPGFLQAQNSWRDIANVYDNATFSRFTSAYTPLHHMKELINNKEDIIWSILIAISLLLIISSFIMINMIVNKLLFLNWGIIGNLKAQGYGTGTIAFLLLSCFLLLMFIIC
ncbi:hypothetical protein [Spiroplasma sp. ChiS]|uniref:hypothetical protein n=1 Tax=Spiroplasma sp. ChiS TaxID=2099885 RepID=UPI001F408BA3|nr:hypothetical protein [Spiroplasma sp. ChiS]